MPVIVATVIRALIQMVVTLGLIELAEKYLMPLINKALVEIVKVFGVSEEEAKDILANDIVRFVEGVGVGVIALRAKLPTIIAERLGFTSKGYAIRTLSTRAQSAVSRVAPSAGVGVGAAPVLAASEAAAVISTARSKIPGFKVAYDVLLKTLGVGFLAALTIAQWIDFGNWNSGAYQKKMQKVLATITFGLLVPDKDWRESLTLSSDVFNKVYQTYKLEGAYAIKDPFKGMSIIFSRESLLDLTDKVGSELLRTTQRASTKDVLIATQLFVSFSLTEPVGAAGATQPAQTAAPPVKIFTGVLTQGALSAPTDFPARESDLIDSLPALKLAAQNNFAPWLAQLFNRVILELKVVPYVINNDGTKRLASTQRVLSYYTNTGQARYKTVSNKFAVMDAFVFTERKRRTKIASITLGPTDAGEIKPTPADLQEIAAAVKAETISAELADISNLVPVKPAGVVAPPAVVAPITKEEVLREARPTGFESFLGGPTYQGFSFRGGSYRVEVGKGQNWVDRAVELLNEKLAPSLTAPAPTAADAAASKELQAAAPKCGARTLYEWFVLNDERFPTVGERAPLYEQLELGPAAWYAGTAEQNTRFLAALKRQSGCP